ncbi:hypothetical protein E4L95_23585 [Paracoccus liaowanqingii]|uniref:Uncharacterized protein n=1 Tax=Paracoccus liaowanqingii TaxID=2560053 RepID=A0A4Z1BL22_9RHOB|nr:hypothetical protein [Paracoccus liaowanqingii]TGN34709.1 hypothetical protein E4L95_23585 [Paracoccus liaowanqingii]
MIELLISACTLSAQLASPPQQCRDFSLLFDAREVSMLTCMTLGQPQVARWKEAHPQWNVRRWQCRTQDRRESRI